MNQHAQPIKDSKSSTVVQNKGEQSGDVLSGDQISDSCAECFHMERTKSLAQKACWTKLRCNESYSSRFT